jgi:GMP synthase-like glutamine amidotransferase
MHADVKDFNLVSVYVENVVQYKAELQRLSRRMNSIQEFVTEKRTAAQTAKIREEDGMEVGGSPAVVHKLSVYKDPEPEFVIHRRSRPT